MNNIKAGAYVQNDFCKVFMTKINFTHVEIGLWHHPHHSGIDLIIIHSKQFYYIITNYSTQLGIFFVCTSLKSEIWQILTVLFTI